MGSRSVTIIDLVKNRRVRDLTVGLRPNDLALAPDGRLFVACSGDNTVHVINTGKVETEGEAASPARRLWEGTHEVISTSLHPQSLEGSTPDALAVSPDGHTLFVADGKGLQSRANFPTTTSDPRSPNQSPLFDYIARTFEGSISAIPRPDTAQMVAYTAQVRRNSPYTPEWLKRAPITSHSVIPTKVGDPCPIKYVLDIIKENRTYDQVLGDLKDATGKPIGNGDPRPTIFGEKVTPNHHQLARDYVLFDNLYSNSEVSVDGHSWCDAAMATDFNQRSWIISYSKHGKLPGNEEMETPANGYLWDLCRRHGVSYKNYGEGAQRVPSANRGQWGNRRQIRDMDKVDFWIADLHAAEKTGVFTRFTTMSLGENHTSGTTPGAFTPTPRWPATTKASPRSSPPPRAANFGPKWRSSSSKTIRRTPRPRRCLPHHGFCDQPLRETRLRRFHALHRRQHAPHDGAHPRPSAAHAKRRWRHAHVQRLSTRSGADALHGALGASRSDGEKHQALGFLAGVLEDGFHGI